MTESNELKPRDVVGVVMFFGAVVAAGYGWFTASLGGILLAVVLLGASVGQFASNNSRSTRETLERIERDLDA